MSVYGGFGNIDYMNESSILPDINAESLVMDESVIPCFEDNFITAGARICTENTINMNNIMEACTIEEFCYLEENGTEMIYEEGKLNSFFTKVKNFFLKLWEKIKSIFKKAILMFDQHAKSDKEFLNKYKKEINQAGNKGFGDKEIPIFKYIWYTGADTNKSLTDMFNADQFTNVTIEQAMQQVQTNSKATDVITMIDTFENAQYDDDSEDCKKAVSDIEDKLKTINEQDWRTDYLDTVRATLIKTLATTYTDNETSASDFAKDIKETIQGDETSKEDVSLYTALNYAKTFLDNKAKNVTANLDHALKLWKKNIDALVKSLENKQKEFTKSNDKNVTKTTRANNFRHTILSAAVNVLQSEKNIGITFHSNVIQGIKACSAQSRSICVQAINYKKPKNESTDLFGESGSLVDNVELI